MATGSRRSCSVKMTKHQVLLRKLSPIVIHSQSVVCLDANEASRSGLASGVVEFLDNPIATRASRDGGKTPVAYAGRE